METGDPIASVRVSSRPPVSSRGAVGGVGSRGINVAVNSNRGPFGKLCLHVQEPLFRWLPISIRSNMIFVVEPAINGLIAFRAVKT